MILITDTNILYSALLKPDSIVAQIFKDKRNLQFIAPMYVFEEIKEHWQAIIKYSQLSEKELKKELSYYKKRIQICRISDPKHLEKAEQIVKDIDPEDVFFVALHFDTGHKIWTGDTALIKGVEAKGYKIFITTAELKAKLYKKKK